MRGPWDDTPGLLQTVRAATQEREREAAAERAIVDRQREVQELILSTLLEIKALLQEGRS